MSEKPLAIDLFCGLFGWSDGFLEEGWRTVGFDLEDMHAKFGIARPPECQLVIQDVLTLDGSQFKNASCIVASPPCQRFSYMSMPWALGKAKAAAIRADITGTAMADLTKLFDACFRIQREACEAAGRHIPMVVENVRGAIPWVGRSRWNFGSYHLWGDVPALMPFTRQRQKAILISSHISDGRTNYSRPTDDQKVPGISWSGSDKPEYVAKALNGEAAKRFREEEHFKGLEIDGRKCGGAWFGAGNNASFMRRHGSKSNARKAASALIAKIPFPLASHIARSWKPDSCR